MAQVKDRYEHECRRLAAWQGLGGVSFSAAMLKQMRDEGLDLDACIRVLEAGERARSAGAERQKRYRDNKRNGRDVTRDVTVSPNEDILTPSNSPSVISDEMTSPVLRPEHVIEHWNDLAKATGLREVKKLTAQRRRKLAIRIRQNTVDEFTEAIDAIGRSPFLRGENERGWRADFDWMLEPKNFTKLIEGNYDR